MNPKMFIVIGNVHTKKSSLIRGLCGARNAGEYDIENENSDKQSTYVHIRSLQEVGKTAEDFISDIEQHDIDQVLVALRERAKRTNGRQYHGYENYIDTFIANNYPITGIVIMGNSELAGLSGLSDLLEGNPIYMDNIQDRAANELASVVRNNWKWK